jgi:hypothetical protein
MQPLYKTEADQSHTAGMQAEQTVTARSRPPRFAGLLFGSASSFQTGSDRQGAVNRGGNRGVS